MTVASPSCPLCGSPIPVDAPSGACPKCLLGAGVATGGAAADATGLGAADLAPKFPDYEILEFLGRGGMGVVWKARHKALDRLVALKVLPPAVAATPGFAERFQREARALARLSHPHVVGVHEYGERDGTYFLVMEYVDGVNLRTALREGRIDARDALRIVPQICDALQYAHDHGVVHRDIKPENVLIASDGRVLVADFGLAKIVGGGAPPELTLAGQVMGTPAYMAPEQVERPASVDHRADIYSLGVVFYEMLTGELPLGRFDAPSKRIEIDVRFDDVVLRSLEKQPERRWQHASDVRAEVGAIAATPAPAPPPVPAASPGSAPPTSRLALAAFFALPAALFFAMLGAAYRRAADVMAAGVGGCLLFAVAGGIVAAGQVRRSRGGRRGLGYAVTAIVLGVLLPTVFVTLKIKTTQSAARGSEEVWALEAAAADAARRATQVRFLGASGAEAGALECSHDERLWIVSQWESARRSLGSRERALAASLYHPTDVDSLKAMPADVLRTKGAAGELGFPLLDPARLGGSASDLRLESVRFDAGGLGATGTATNGRVRVRFPLARFRTGPADDRMTSYLYFGVGPVEIE